MFGNFSDDGRTYQEVWHRARKLAKLTVSGICSDCRVSISASVDVNAAELFPEISSLTHKELGPTDCETLSRWATKTSLLFVASETSFITEKLKHTIRMTVRDQRQLANNIQVSIARIPSTLKITMTFRNIAQFKVPGTISVISCRNVALLAYVPHQSSLPIEETIPRGDPYWAFARNFSQIWPYREPLQWPIPQVDDVAKFNVELNHVRHKEPQADPIREALRKAGLIQPWEV